MLSRLGELYPKPVTISEQCLEILNSSPGTRDFFLISLRIYTVYKLLKFVGSLRKKGFEVIDNVQPCKLITVSFSAYPTTAYVV